MKSQVQSVCVFGSAARGSVDRLSDRDVLIVASDPTKRSELVSRWSQQGWSVAAFSPERLQRMAATGSLFVQHLKKEGKVIEDKGGWLCNLFSHAIVRTDYQVDALQSVYLMKPMERLINGTWEQLLASDIAFTAFRNFAICFLAGRGEFTFGYDQAMRSLRPHLNLTEQQVDLLISLRRFKSAYRARKPLEDNPPSIENLHQIANVVFGIGSISPIMWSAPVRWLLSPYATGRDFEALIVSELGSPLSDSSIVPLSLSKAWQIVTHPRQYSWDLRKISASWLDKINREVEIRRKSASGVERAGLG